MKFSTESLQQIAELFTNEIKAQMEDEVGAKISEIENTMREMLREVGAHCLSQYLTEQEEGCLKRTIECNCGGNSQYLFRRSAKVLSVFGWIAYRRSYYVCAECHQGQHPLDQCLGLEPGQVTAGLASLLGIAGVQTSFGEASHMVKRFLLLEVSENTVRKETQIYGQLQAEREAIWIAESHDPEVLQSRKRIVQDRPKRLYGSIDGAHAPLSTEWRELKTGCWYEVERVSASQVSSSRRPKVGDLGALRANDITYYCDLERSGPFGKLFWATGCQRNADLAEEIIFVADGAAWIWKLVEYYYPKAVQIVDWYHAEGYLDPISKDAFCDDQEAAEKWLDQARSHLWEGQVAKVISACQAFVDHPQAGRTAQKAITYYTNYQHRLDYAYFRAAGYMIGSGTVESGCKQIVTQRLKRSGARWTEPGARATAKARAGWLSDHWDHLSTLRSQLPLAV